MGDECRGDDGGDACESAEGTRAMVGELTTSIKLPSAAAWCRMARVSLRSNNPCACDWRTRRVDSSSARLRPLRSARRSPSVPCPLSPRAPSSQPLPIPPERRTSPIVVLNTGEGVDCASVGTWPRRVATVWRRCCTCVAKIKKALQQHSRALDHSTSPCDPPRQRPLARARGRERLHARRRRGGKHIHSNFRNCSLQSFPKSHMRHM
jgi:hypothetical protein